MINELLFITHIVVISSLLFGCLLHSYGALIGFLLVQVIAANIFVTKQIMVAGFVTTASEVFIVCGMWGVSLVQEYYGQEAARRTIWYSFFAMVFFALVSQFHLLYTGPSDASIGTALATVMAHSPRVVLASFIAYFVSERVHIMLYQRAGRVAAITMGQIIDTVVFGYVGLYGIIDHLGQVMLVSIGIKLVVISCLFVYMRLVKSVMERLGVMRNWQKSE